MDKRVHGGGSGSAEHRVEAGCQDPVIADGFEHVDLIREYPIAAISQHAAKPLVDVSCYVGKRKVREHEQRA